MVVSQLAAPVHSQPQGPDLVPFPDPGLRAGPDLLALLLVGAVPQAHLHLVPDQPAGPVGVGHGEGPALLQLVVVELMGGLGLPVAHRHLVGARDLDVLVAAHRGAQAPLLAQGHVQGAEERPAVVAGVLLLLVPARPQVAPVLEAAADQGSQLLARGAGGHRPAIALRDRGVARIDLEPPARLSPLRSGRPPAGPDQDHPAEGVRAVQDRARTADHLDPLDDHGIDGVQALVGAVAGGRVVEPDAVHHHEHLVAGQPADEGRAASQVGLLDPHPGGAADGPRQGALPGGAQLLPGGDHPPGGGRGGRLLRAQGGDHGGRERGILDRQEKGEGEQHGRAGVGVWGSGCAEPPWAGPGPF